MKEKKKKKSINWQVILMFCIFLVIGLFCGRIIAVPRGLTDVPGGFFLSIVMVFLLIYAAMILQIAIHEAGHLIFGLLTGYRFVSYRIGSLMWVKIHGKIHLKRYQLAGTGGQCLLAPPEYREGTFPVTLYNLGGPLINLLAAGIFAVPALLLNDLWSDFFWLLVGCGVGFALTNGIPLSTGAIDNDGKNALSLSKNPKALRAFWVQMQINARMTEGVRLKDMPEDWFTVPADEDLDNPLISAVGVFAANRFMDQHRFAEADTLMAHLLDTAENMLGLYRELLINDRIYCEILGENRREVLEDFCTKSHNKMMKSMKNLPSVLRTQYACALRSEQRPDQAEKIKAAFLKLEKTYPYAAELAGERELLELVERA